MPPASSTAQAQSVTQPQSLAFVKNMCRHVFSEICSSRRLFSNESFEEIDMCGVRINSLGRMEEADKKHVSEEAKQFMALLEGGVFEALYKGYLEKCVLIVSRDKAGEDVLEAWAVSVDWLKDADGNCQPSVKLGSESNSKAKSNSKASAPQLKGGGQISKEDVRKTSTAMLRQLTVLLQTMPELPSDYWISMKLFYRDEVTPIEYEPAGFEAAPPESDGTLLFHEKPVCVGIGPGLKTNHNAVKLQVVMPVEGEYETLAGSSKSCKRLRSDLYRVDLFEGSATPAPRETERVPKNMIDASRRALLNLLDGLACAHEVTSEMVAENCHCSRLLAEELLQELEETHLTPWCNVRRSRLLLTDHADAGDETQGQADEGACSATDVDQPDAACTLRRQTRSIRLNSGATPKPPMEFPAPKPAPGIKPPLGTPHGTPRTGTLPHHGGFTSSPAYRYGGKVSQSSGHIGDRRASNVAIAGSYPRC